VYSRVKYYRRAYGTLLRFEDAEAAALYGAMQAARTYTSARGSFPNFAIRHIDGEIKEVVREAQSGVVHIPKDALREQGRPTYMDMEALGTAAVPDALTQAMEAEEKAAAVSRAQSRVKRIREVLRRHLPERALRVFEMLEGEGLNQGEVAETLRIGRATVQRDYWQAKSVIESLKDRNMLKSAIPMPRSALTKLTKLALRSARLNRYYALFRQHPKALPPGILLEARLAAERARGGFLALDQEIAERLLNPSALLPPPLVLRVDTAKSPPTPDNDGYR
jgi:RNA polymerase sigma factor (sigma-70 family)